MSEIVIEAFNAKLRPGDLDELVRVVHEVDPDGQVRTYESGTKGLDPETRELITFWIAGTQALTPDIRFSVPLHDLRCRNAYHTVTNHNAIWVHRRYTAL